MPSQSSEPIGQFNNKLAKTEDKLEIVITGDVYNHLRRFSGKMKGASNPRDVVELALELLLRAEDKDIAIMDGERVIARYTLWK